MTIPTTYTITDQNGKHIFLAWSRKRALEVADRYVMSLNPDTDEFPTLTLTMQTGGIKIQEEIEL